MSEIVPHDQRVVGERYLEGCGHYHVWHGPDYDPVEEAIKTVTLKMAEQIDAEILKELSEQNQKTSPRVR